MDVAFARALLKDGRLDREIERRRLLRELEEERQWLAADDGGLSLLVGLLGRLEAELDRPVAAGQECDTEAIQALESLHAQCLELLEKLEVLAARDEDDAAGIEHRCGVHSVVQIGAPAGFSQAFTRFFSRAEGGGFGEDGGFGGGGGVGWLEARQGSLL